MCTCAPLFSLAKSMVSSGTSSMHLMVPKSRHTWLTDSTSLHIMLMDCALVLQWVLSLPPCV